MKTLLVLVAFIQSLACMAQEQIDNLKEQTLKGKVKVVRYFHDLGEKDVFRTGVYKKTSYSVDSFNTYGYEVLSYEVENGEKLNERRVEYKRDAKENIIEKVSHYSNDGSSIRKTFEYNSAGNLVQEKSYNGDGDLYIWKSYSYVSKQEIIQQDLHTVSKDITVYKYGENGKVVEKIVVDISGPVTIKYKYDKRGNKISEV